MNQTDKAGSTRNTVSTVTKHIKIYSNNPIHDCIDRIITACTYMDSGGKDLYDACEELNEAAEELSRLAQRKSLSMSADKLIKRSEQKPN